MPVEELSFSAALIAGLLSFASPCVLPLVPGYIGYLLTVAVLAQKDGERGTTRRPGSVRIKKGGRRKSNRYAVPAIKHSLVFMLGFSLIFVVFTADLKSIYHFSPEYLTFGRMLVGIILVILGLKLVGILRGSIPLIYPNRVSQGFWKKQGATLVPAAVQDAQPRPGLLATFLIGMLLSAGWTPCIGPVLGSVIEGISEKDTVLQGIYLLGSYSLGLAIPFLVIGLIPVLLFTGLLNRTKYTRAGVRIIGGFLLLLVGILIFTNLFQLLPQFFNWEVLTRIDSAATAGRTRSIILARPQPLVSKASPSPLVLIRLRPATGRSSLEFFRQLSELEPVRAGRFQPLDYTSASSGSGERILAVVSSRDEASFASSGLDYSRLDTEADTARYFSLTIPTDSNTGNEVNQQNLDEHWQLLERSGNRLIFKAELPLYLGLGARSKLLIEKLPPRIYLPGLTAACPCPALVAAAFLGLGELMSSANLVATGSLTQGTGILLPVSTSKGSEWLQQQLAKVNEEALKQLTNQISQNQVSGKGSFNTRYTGSAGSVYFAERLYTYFFALGLKVEYDSFVEVALGTLTTNVVAQQPAEKNSWGAAPVLLVAHYDSLGERKSKGISSPTLLAYGANDNGVGLAGLVEVARLLSSYRFKAPVRYIAFGAEEQGMLGSQHYVQHQLSQEQVSTVINLDSFGYNPGEEDRVILGYGEHGIELKEALVKYEEKYDIGLQLELRGGEASLRSDDYSFDKLEHRAVILTDSFTTLSPPNHSPDDRVANLNFKTVYKVTQLALVSVAELAGFTF